jgi:ribonuclease I
MPCRRSCLKNFKRFGDGKAAYVNVVAWAESAKHCLSNFRAESRRQRMNRHRTIHILMSLWPPLDSRWKV